MSGRSTANARRGVICLLALGLSAVSARPAVLSFAGVLGNSGGEGPTVIRSAVGRAGGGVVVDAQARLFTGGGDRILVLSRLGNRLWETPLPQPDWVLGGPTFALAGKYLYFIAGKPSRYEGNYNYLWNPFTLVEPNLCRVETAPGAVPEVLAAAPTFQWLGAWWGGEVALAAAPGAQTAYVGFSPACVTNGQYIRQGYRVMEVQPDGALVKVFETPVAGGRLSVDERGCFFLGGGGMVRKFDRDWRPATDFAPVELPRLGAVPTGYSGAVMLTGGALWDMGHYGFIGRYTRDMKPNPGVLVQWAHALNWVAQVADAPRGEYYIKSDDALYVAAVVDDRLVLHKRFGSLPRVNCLVLSSAGYIGVGTDSRLLWFDFDADSCAAAPVKTQFPGPVTQGLADGDAGLLALGISPAYLPQEYAPTPRGIALLRYAAEPLRAGSDQAQSQADGEYNGRLAALVRVDGSFFAVDATNGGIVRADAKAPCHFAPFSLDLPAGARPTSLAGWTDRCLLVAAGGQIHAFALAADGRPTLAWSWNGGAAAFGAELHLAVSGNALLVADTRRHGVRLLAFSERTDQPPVPVAQYGEADQPGNDLAHFDSPTLVSLSGTRAVVYDAGNQRVVRLSLRPDGAD